MSHPHRTQDARSSAEAAADDSAEVAWRALGASEVVVGGYEGEMERSFTIEQCLAVSGARRVRVQVALLNQSPCSVARLPRPARLSSALGARVLSRLQVA